MRERIPFDLQFFAESETESEAAEPTGAEEQEVVEEPTGENEAEPAEQQTPEQNAQYAAIRRKAEYDAQMKYQSEQARLDAKYADMCKGMTNPETGQPIRGAQDYFEALQAQERLRAKSDMEEAGLDPAILDRAIASSPLIQQAQAAIEQNNQIQSQRMVEEDMRKIISFDPSVSSEQDIVTQPNFGEVIDYVTNHPGMRLDDAYKIVNFDRLSSQRVKSAEQSAINQAKSKNHLSTPAGLAGDDSKVDIPADKLAMWQDWFPDKKPSELKELYNKQIGG